MAEATPPLAARPNLCALAAAASAAVSPTTVPRSAPPPQRKTRRVTAQAAAQLQGRFSQLESAGGSSGPLR